MQLIYLRRRRLDEGGNGQRLLRAHGQVANPHLDGVEEGMRADVPPDLLGVVEAIGLDEHVNEVFEVAVAGEGVRNIGARELVEDLGAVAFESGVITAPKGRVSRERKDMGQE